MYDIPNKELPHILSMIGIYHINNWYVTLICWWCVICMSQKNPIGFSQSGKSLEVLEMSWFFFVSGDKIWETFEFWLISADDF